MSRGAVAVVPWGGGIPDASRGTAARWRIPLEYNHRNNNIPPEQALKYLFATEGSGVEGRGWRSSGVVQYSST